VSAEDRKIVIAVQKFYAGDLRQWVGKHPAVVAPGFIERRQELYSAAPSVTDATR